MTLHLFLSQRITVPEILKDDWFKRGYKTPDFEQGEEVNLDDVDAVFNDSEVNDYYTTLYKGCFNIFSFPAYLLCKI